MTPPESIKWNIVEVRSACTPTPWQFRAYSSALLNGYERYITSCLNSANLIPRSLAIPPLATAIPLVSFSKYHGSFIIKWQILWTDLFITTHKVG